MPRPFGRGPFGALPYSAAVSSDRLYGAWHYGIEAYSRGGLTIDLAGIARAAFMPTAEMELTWAQPQQMCEPGIWTLTSLPAGPPNELEPV